MRGDVEQIQLTPEQIQMIVALMKLEGWSQRSERSASSYVRDVLGDEAYRRWTSPPYARRQAQYQKVWAYFGVLE